MLRRFAVLLLVLWLLLRINHGIGKISKTILTAVTIFLTGMDESHNRISPSLALRKPNITSWELDGHYLVVNWEHSDVDNLVHGYYVLLCQLVNSQCTGPDFVNFGRTVRSGRIIGLAPETHYEVEVTLY